MARRRVVLPAAVLLALVVSVGGNVLLYRYSHAKCVALVADAQHSVALYGDKATAAKEILEKYDNGNVC